MQDAVDAVFQPHCVVLQLLNAHSLCSSDDAVCSRLGFASIALPCSCKTVLILTFCSVLQFHRCCMGWRPPIRVCITASAVAAGLIPYFARYTSCFCHSSLYLVVISHHDILFLYASFFSCLPCTVTAPKPSCHILYTPFSTRHALSLCHRPNP